MENHDDGVCVFCRAGHRAAQCDDPWSSGPAPEDPRQTIAHRLLPPTRAPAVEPRSAVRAAFKQAWGLLLFSSFQRGGLARARKELEELRKERDAAQEERDKALKFFRNYTHRLVIA